MRLVGGKSYILSDDDKSLIRDTATANAVSRGLRGAGGVRGRGKKRRSQG